MHDEDSTYSVGIVGSGRLAQVISSSHSERVTLTSTELPDIRDDHHFDLILTVTDYWDTEFDELVADTMLHAPTQWLTVRVRLDKVIIGPLTLPGIPGCYWCANHRSDRAKHDYFNELELLKRHGREIAKLPPLLTGPAIVLVADLVSSELQALSMGDQQLRTRNAIAIIGLNNPTVRVHRVRPAPTCTRCNILAPDSEAAAQIAIASHIKPRQGELRSRDLIERRHELISVCVDPEVGIVSALTPLTSGTFPVVEAKIGLEQRKRPECTYGKSSSMTSCEVVAIAEALERYGGWNPTGKKTMVRASFKEVATQAIDPKTFGLYPDDRYSLPDFRYQTYRDDLSMNWVWAYSFRRQSAVLVPESYAYYGLPQARTGSDRAFVQEISNGCAVGSTLEEAILYGLLEISERDAFLMTWLARLRVPKIDPRSANDSVMPLMVDHIKFQTGYDITIYNTTTENRIPAFWAMATAPSNEKNLPKLICSGAAHPFAEKAALSAIRELSLMIDALPDALQSNLPLTERFLADDDSVTEMAHHTLLYCNPNAFDRLSFLISDGAEMSTFSDFDDQWYWPQYQDIQDDLQELIRRYNQSDLDVIVVDQTGPDHKAADLVCVKVIVPGTIPITFGHRYRRVDGLNRLFSVPKQLGYKGVPNCVEQLNPFPHPFP